MRQGAAGKAKQRMTVSTLCALLGGFAGLSPATEVYKSVDAEGHVVYSDRAGAKSAQKSEVRVEAPNPIEAARLAREQELLKAGQIQQQRQQSAEEQRNALQQRERLMRCESARNQYYALKDARRIYDRDAEGNRIYYSDAEGDAKRAEARQAMLAACAT